MGPAHATGTILRYDTTPRGRRVAAAPPAPPPTARRPFGPLGHGPTARARARRLRAATFARQRLNPRNIPPTHRGRSLRSHLCGCSGTGDRAQRGRMRIQFSGSYFPIRSLLSSSAHPLPAAPATSAPLCATNALQHSAVGPQHAHAGSGSSHKLRLHAGDDTGIGEVAHHPALDHIKSCAGGSRQAAQQHARNRLRGGEAQQKQQVGEGHTPPWTASPRRPPHRADSGRGTHPPSALRNPAKHLRSSL